MSTQKTIKLLSLIKRRHLERLQSSLRAAKKTRITTYIQQVMSVQSWLCSIYSYKYLCPLKAEMAVLADSNHLGR